VAHHSLQVCRRLDELRLCWHGHHRHHGRRCREGQEGTSV
jgi:hypothetical protein